MNNPKLIRFYSAKTLIDVMAVGDAGDPSLLTIEHLYQTSKAWLDNPAERTVWRSWSWEEPAQRFRQLSEDVVGLPTTQAASASLSKHRLVALLEVNQRHAAFLGAWNLTASNPPRIPEASSTVLPVDLDEGEAQRVQIKVDEEWSSATLPTRDWLFNPSVASLPGGSDVIIAMNTADARAILWETDGASLPKKPMLFLPDALEPAVCPLGSKRLLFYRKPAPGWSVYFHDMRFSGAYGPVALPLVLAELGGDGHINHLLDLSHERGLGNVFSYSVSGDFERRFTLAVISGSKERPDLGLYLSTDFGQTLKELGSLKLPGVPYRTSVAMSGSAAVVGLVYKQTEGYQIAGLRVPLGK